MVSSCRYNYAFCSFCGGGGSIFVSGLGRVKAETHPSPCHSVGQLALTRLSVIETIVRCRRTDLSWAMNVALCSLALVFAWNEFSNLLRRGMTSRNKAKYRERDISDI